MLVIASLFDFLLKKCYNIYIKEKGIDTMNFILPTITINIER